MYFGSVKFFRHLILTVVFGWIAAATVLAVFFGIKCHRLENEEKVPLTIEDHIAQMTDEGFTVEEIKTFLNRGSDGAVIASADAAPEKEKPEKKKPVLTEAAQPETSAPSDSFESAAESQDVPAETVLTEAPPSDAPDVSEAFSEVTEAEGLVKPYETEPSETTPPNASLSELYPKMLADKPANRTSPKSGTVILTFEAAPSGNMSDILIILGRQNAKASFMLSDCGDEDDSEMIKNAYDMGCTMGVLAGENKAYSSAADYLKDFSRIYEGIGDICGKTPSLYRIPDSAEMSDSVRREVVNELDRRGFTYCGFNTLSDDRVQGMDWQQLYDTVTSRVFLNRVAEKASVVQLHSGQNDSLTVFTAEDIIIGLREEGYSFDAFRDTMLTE